MKNPKIEFKEIITGSGTAAVGNVWVRIRCRIFLNRGEEIKGLWGDDENGICFRLHDREIIAGLRSAVDGMRVGGRRIATIPPHLAFHQAGIPGLVPPNAVLRAEIELLEAGQADEPLPNHSGQQRGRALTIMAKGEESSRLPRWKLSFWDQDDPYYPSKCFLHLEWSTRSDGKWGRRSAQHKRIELDLTPREITKIIDTAENLPLIHPAECLGHCDVHTHGGQSPTRANTDSTLCLHVSMCEDNKYREVCYLRENSTVWTEIPWGKRLMDLVRPYLTEAPWRRQSQRRLP